MISFKKMVPIITYNFKKNFKILNILNKRCNIYNNTKKFKGN